ncbi:MAG: hypothetical protein SFW67_08230 [Myxococcaceae bacterium]|nr:hypothetical protein [Myxococcaceae bacterium]
MRHFIHAVFFLLAACGPVDSTPDAGRPPRFVDDGGTVDGGGCLRCSMIAGFLTQGAPVGLPMMGDPCAMGPGGPGGPGGMGGFSICNQSALDGLTGCLMANCAAACGNTGPGMGPGPMCVDGGVAGFDAGQPMAPPDAGGQSCSMCLMARCTAALTTCEADR